MDVLDQDDKLAAAAAEAIRTGDVSTLQRLLAGNPELAAARLVRRETSDGARNAGESSRTLLHVATDWPGHFPNGAAVITLLTESGADVNARFAGAHTETPLHWAASTDDVEAIDALLDAGADLEAPGAVIAGGTPLDDAVAFAQWRAAERLVERGARFALWHAAALGRMDAIQSHFDGAELPERHPWGASGAVPADQINVSFWCACHGGQQRPAEYLLARGADLNWVSVWDGLTPLDAAQRSEADGLVRWLRSLGARKAGELQGPQGS